MFLSRYSMASSSSTTPLAEMFDPSHLQRSRGQEPRIVLISLGWNGQSCEYIKFRFPSLFVQIEEMLWHRIDLLCDSHEHLCKFGTEEDAQAQFKRLHARYDDYVESLEREIRAGLEQESDVAHFLVCRSGHHRSVALLEILYQSLREELPDTEIITWHLDHFRRGGSNRNLDCLRWFQSANFDASICIALSAFRACPP